jgi:hypothetical protein
MAILYLQKNDKCFRYLRLNRKSLMQPFSKRIPLSAKVKEAIVTLNESKAKRKK